MLDQFLQTTKTEPQYEPEKVRALMLLVYLRILLPLQFKFEFFTFFFFRVLLRFPHSFSSGKSEKAPDTKGGLQPRSESERVGMNSVMEFTDCR
jgi:hypothetical protein